jgi:hypothetical protein
MVPGRYPILMVETRCLECRGVRDLCHKGKCEVLEAVRSKLPPVRRVGRILEGPSPPDVFVGFKGYPEVGVGPLVPSEAEVTEGGPRGGPSTWREMPIETLVAQRSLLYHPRQGARVRSPRSGPRLLELAQEVALSARPVDTEVVLTRPYQERSVLHLDPFAAPMGPALEAIEGRVIGNPSVPRRVDQLASDEDARASTASVELHRSGVGEDHITRLLSVGLLGKAKTRRLVPTRWSITAVDDTLSKAIADRVRQLQELGELRLHRSELFGNHFHVLLLPGPWAFEMVEAWVQGALWSSKTIIVSDWEGHRGRRRYATKVMGAYYAARLAVLEHLAGINRQATAVIYREVTEEYWAPLGVWVIREGVRSALSSDPYRPEDLEAAIASISHEVRIKQWQRSSRLISDARSQRRLEDFKAQSSE